MPKSHGLEEHSLRADFTCFSNRVETDPSHWSGKKKMQEGVPNCRGHHGFA